MLLACGRLLFAMLLMLATSLPARSEPPAEKKQPVRLDRYGDPLLEGAIARLGTVRLRHENTGVLWTAFADAGKVIASGSAYGLHLWDTASGKLLAQITGDFQLGGMVASPDGKWLALREEDSITIRNARSGQLIRRWPAPAKLSQSAPLAVSIDGKQLAVGGEGTVHLWNTATGKETFRLEAHEGPLCRAAFMPDGSTLVTSGFDDRVCTWDVATGKLRGKIETRIRPWRTLSLSHDG